MNIDVTLKGGERPRYISLSGRIGQTMHALLEAKGRGITSLEHPALRLAAYVHSLRKMGFTIDTEMEQHDGPYPGIHARYRLRSAVSLGHNCAKVKQ
ncbi:winged helix domain-containing protein [Lentibacter sp.]|uniref:winged helix domain-containing protein n=1 Tax=Lentibacter sp. TaxID=2024994 RepID=UPI003F6B769B